MTEFLQSTLTVNWWLSVVVVGLLINLLSAYLKAPLDAVGSRFFSFWRRRLEEAEKRWRLDAELLLSNPEEMASARYHALRLRAKSIWWLIAMAGATTVYASDRILRGLEVLFSEKLPDPDFFSSKGRAIFLILLILALIRAMASAMSADDAEERVRRAEAKR
jgi:hypothetical protein